MLQVTLMQFISPLPDPQRWLPAGKTNGLPLILFNRNALSLVSWTQIDCATGHWH